jgi:hypothetical protein
MNHDRASLRRVALKRIKKLSTSGVVGRATRPGVARQRAADQPQDLSAAGKLFGRAVTASTAIRRGPLKGVDLDHRGQIASAAASYQTSRLEGL